VAIEIEHYTDSEGRACMRLRKLGDDPAPSNVTPLRAGEVLASVMVPVEAARGTTRSAIVHMPIAAPQPTPDELKIAALLGITPQDFARQRARERSGEGGAGRWSSGAAGGDE
jgi:hypothetical protein